MSSAALVVVAVIVVAVIVVAVIIIAVVVVVAGRQAGQTETDSRIVTGAAGRGRLMRKLHGLNGRRGRSG